MNVAVVTGNKKGKKHLWGSRTREKVREEIASIDSHIKVVKNVRDAKIVIIPDTLPKSSVHYKNKKVMQESEFLRYYKIYDHPEKDTLFQKDSFHSPFPNQVELVVLNEIPFPTVEELELGEEHQAFVEESVPILPTRSTLKDKQTKQRREKQQTVLHGLTNVPIYFENPKEGERYWKSMADPQISDYVRSIFSIHRISSAASHRIRSQVLQQLETASFRAALYYAQVRAKIESVPSPDMLSPLSSIFDEECTQLDTRHWVEFRTLLPSLLDMSHGQDLTFSQKDKLLLKAGHALESIRFDIHCAQKHWKVLFEKWAVDFRREFDPNQSTCSKRSSCPVSCFPTPSGSCVRKPFLTVMEDIVTAVCEHHSTHDTSVEKLAEIYELYRRHYRNWFQVDRPVATTTKEMCADMIQMYANMAKMATDLIGFEFTSVPWDRVLKKLSIHKNAFDNLWVNSPSQRKMAAEILKKEGLNAAAIKRLVTDMLIINSAAHVST